MSQCEFIGDVSRIECYREATAVLAYECTACGDVSKAAGCDRCIAEGLEYATSNAAAIQHLGCGAVGGIKLSEPVRLRTAVSS